MVHPAHRKNLLQLELMKAQELRLGNLILPAHDLDGKYITVASIEEDCINTYSPEANHYSGIPLTEEWLLKFGFEKTLPHIKGSVLKDEYDKSFVRVSNRLGQFDFHGATKLDYVHQLQNLFFTLTGQELKIT